MKKKEIEKLSNSCGDLSLDVPNQDGMTKAETELFEKEYDKAQEHPTPEQLLLRESLKILEPKQLEIWEMWNYDRMTQDEIAKKLKVTQQAIQKQLKSIEKKLTKWVQSNLEAYKLLKQNIEGE